MSPNSIRAWEAIKQPIFGLDEAEVNDKVLALLDKHPSLDPFDISIALAPVPEDYDWNDAEHVTAKGWALGLRPEEQIPDWCRGEDE